MVIRGYRQIRGLRQLSFGVFRLTKLLKVLVEKLKGFQQNSLVPSRYRAQRDQAERSFKKLRRDRPITYGAFRIGNAPIESHQSRHMGARPQCSVPNIQEIQSLCCLEKAQSFSSSVQV